MAKLFRRLSDLLRGGPKTARTIVPPVHPAKPEQQPVRTKATAAPPTGARSAEPPTPREPAVPAEPRVAPEPPVPGP
jgi:hypothetical protein